MDPLFQLITALPSELSTLIMQIAFYISFLIMALTGGPADCNPMPALCY